MKDGTRTALELADGLTLRVDGGFVGYYFDGDSKARFEHGYA